MLLAGTYELSTSDLLSGFQNTFLFACASLCAHGFMFRNGVRVRSSNGRISLRANEKQSQGKAGLAPRVILV